MGYWEKLIQNKQKAPSSTVSLTSDRFTALLVIAARMMKIRILRISIFKIISYA